VGGNESSRGKEEGQEEERKREEDEEWVKEKEGEVWGKGKESWKCKKVRNVEREMTVM
jgi:hypothetical protein